jgi:pimeloyl-ACP methyl ester carboxylesterase
MKRNVFRKILAVLVITLIPVVTPLEPVAAETDSLITALVFNESEATTLGLQFHSMDDTSGGDYVTARYDDPSPGAYTIIYTVTLSPYRGVPSDSPNIIFEDETYGCTKCIDPDCQQIELTDGRFVPAKPCYSPYRNGYTNFGQLSGETVFSQGDLLVKIESTTSYGVTTPEYHALSKSQHEWFVEQLTNKITANYQDVMQLSAYAYIAPQPMNQGLAYEGQDVVFLEGDVTGPNGGVPDVRLEGFYYSESGSGWNYALKTDATGHFKGMMGLATEVSYMSVKANHTETSPAYAGTDTIWVRDLNGQPTATEAGIVLSIDTDKKAYSAGETVVIQGAASDDSGPLTGASVTVNVSGTQLPATTDASGNYRVEFPIPQNVTQAVYTATATASYSGYPDKSNSTSFVVGDIGLIIEMNPATSESFIGVTADGISSLVITVSLPGCTDVSISPPDIGRTEGSTLDATGGLTLDAAGLAEITYYPPDYLTKGQLTRELSVHQSDARVWAAPVPLALTYTDASGQTGQASTEILVCRPPVMLVHGFLGGTATWGKMASYLQGDKFDTYLGDYGASDQSIEGLALILKNDIRQQKTEYTAANIKIGKLDAVGHSMGGLISRYYSHGLTSYDGDLRKLIMVGTPNHGVSWSKKITGNLGAGWYQTHRMPAEQLYEESPFMKALNSGETTGAHLNPDIQYGNIYGFPDDWVVNAASAYLNGVASVTEADVKHSPDIPSVPHVAITEYLNVWDQVNTWLTSDIYRPPLKGTHIEVYKYWGDVYQLVYDAWGNHETQITASPTQIDTFQGLRTGPDSKAIIHLSIDDTPWGVIFLDPDSEIFLGYCSPQMVEIRLWQGGATFRSKEDGHFTVPVNISRSQDGEWWSYRPKAVVTGLNTEFAITAGANIEVHCLEGGLVVDTPDATGDGTTLSAENSVSVTGEVVTTITPVSEDDFWWASEDDDFLDAPSGGGWLDKLKGAWNSFLDWITSFTGCSR